MITKKKVTNIVGLNCSKDIFQKEIKDRIVSIGNQEQDKRMRERKRLREWEKKEGRNLEKDESSPRDQ